MNFTISANTDVGVVKTTNQDSLSSMVLHTPQGPMAFAVLCDGMGGLEYGELASAAVVRAFHKWAMAELPKLCEAPLEDNVIRRHWQNIISDLNVRIQRYATQKGIRMGTTVVAILLTQERYYILNVGDSRCYELANSISQITKDHSFVARELDAGRITPEEAVHHPRRNVLTQCVGASREVYADMFFGRVKKNAVYMLCSDGFCHELTPKDLFENLRPDILCDENTMQKQAELLIRLNKQRGEDDNISVALVRTL